MMDIGNCMDGVGMGGMAVWMLVWSLAGLVVLIAVILGTVWLVRRTANGGGGRTDTAENVLKRRLASGEIDEDEYQRLRSRLTE
jgi:putative membrane protein